MQVVYSPAHLGHDITVETSMGMPIPANEVAERAERIRTALLADGGFAVTAPTEHGEAPITAVHDPGLVRFLETATGVEGFVVDEEVDAAGRPRPFHCVVRAPAAARRLRDLVQQIVEAEKPAFVTYELIQTEVEGAH